MERKRYVNIGFLTLTVFSIVLLIYWQLTNEHFFISETIALMLFSISLIFKILSFRNGQYILFFLLFILLFQIVNISFTIADGNTSTTYNSGAFLSLGFNPIIFVVFMLFIAVNRRVMFALFKTIFYGSDKEREEKQSKDIAFYYNKFKTYSPEDLSTTLKMYEDYPAEAQIALSKLKSEMGI